MSLIQVSHICLRVSHTSLSHLSLSSKVAETTRTPLPIRQDSSVHSGERQEIAVTAAGTEMVIHSCSRLVQVECLSPSLKVPNEVCSGNRSHSRFGSLYESPDCMKIGRASCRERGWSEVVM